VWNCISEGINFFLKEDILKPIAKKISLSNLKQNSSDVQKSELRGRVIEQIAKASKS